MDIDGASIEFQSWDIYQKVDTLSALDTFTAAALLTRTKQKERKQLLGMLEPYLAANIVQVGCVQLLLDIVATTYLPLTPTEQPR